jgi:hypothetical protein
VRQATPYNVLVQIVALSPTECSEECTFLHTQWAMERVGETPTEIGWRCRLWQTAPRSPFWCWLRRNPITGRALRCRECREAQVKP